MKTLSAVRRASSTIVSRLSCEAVMSRKIELVGALGVVALGELHRVTGVADVDEVRALDDAAVVDVEAGDDALQDHASRLTLRRCPRSGRRHEAALAVAGFA